MFTDILDIDSYSVIQIGNENAGNILTDFMKWATYTDSCKTVFP